MLDDELTSRVMFREIYRFDGQDRDILLSYMQGTSQKDISEKLGISAEVISGIKDIIDCNLYFFGNQVSIGTKYGIMIGSIILLIGAYIHISVLRAKKKKLKILKQKNTGTTQYFLLFKNQNGFSTKCNCCGN